VLTGKLPAFACVATSKAPAATTKVSDLMGVSSCCPPTQCNVLIFYWFRAVSVRRAGDPLEPELPRKRRVASGGIDRKRGNHAD
jgi:hypothetical protein